MFSWIGPLGLPRAAGLKWRLFPLRESGVLPKGPDRVGCATGNVHSRIADNRVLPGASKQTHRAGRAGRMEGDLRERSSSLRRLLLASHSPDRCRLEWAQFDQMYRASGSAQFSDTTAGHHRKAISARASLSLTPSNSCDRSDLGVRGFCDLRRLGGRSAGSVSSIKTGTPGGRSVMNRYMATDADLLRASRRQPDAYVEVCERHFADVATWLRQQVGHTEAEDLLAETLARGWYARKRFRDPGTGSAGPWLQGIAMNVVREYRRKGAIDMRARRKLGLQLAGEAASDEEIDARITAVREFAAVSPSLKELPDEQREALALRVVDELEYDEIGVRQGVSTATARTRVHRALKNLRLAMNGGKE
jgi:RNA polymerase sigma-70 factor, ECF subfamily